MPEGAGIPIIHLLRLSFGRAHNLGNLYPPRVPSETANNIKIAITIAIIHFLSGAGCQMLGANEHHGVGGEG